VRLILPMKAAESKNPWAREAAESMVGCDGKGFSWESDENPIKESTHMSKGLELQGRPILHLKVIIR
jgi:hypothetical protein